MENDKKFTVEVKFDVVLTQQDIDDIIQYAIFGEVIYG